MVCGPYLANIITRPMARQLQFINVLAVVLIAFDVLVIWALASTRSDLRA